MAKITLIGAGSVVFAKNLIGDILQYPALAGSTICLMDIDATRLEVTRKIAERMVAQLGVPARVEATLDLRQACAGARYVITTIQVGGYKPSTVVDFEIPARYGVRQTIADTLGVGGIFRALRSIPELVKVARTLEEVGAEKSLLLNYTNPMAMNMWGMDRLSGIPAVGLCHSVQGTLQQISHYCNLDPTQVAYQVAGINHMAFFLRFEHKGKDAYPLLFRALENPGTVAYDRVRFEMMRRLGYFVTESSEHQSEYGPHFLHHGEEVIREFAIPINEYLRRCEVIQDIWHKNEAELLDTSRPLEIRRSVEYGSTIIGSMESGVPSVVYGNVPNRGLISNLREGCCVEVPCLVDRQGLQPTRVGALPPQLEAIINTNLNVQELAVEAAVTRQREYIYQAAMMDPNTAASLPLDRIWAMCDELIEAHQRDGFLGEFHPVVRNTGKPLSEAARVFLSIEAVGLPFFGGEREAELHLVAENRLGTPFCGEVGLSVSGQEGVALSVEKLAVEVAAGETMRLPFRVVRTTEGEISHELIFAITSASAQTVELDLHLPVRERLEIPTDPSGEQRLPLEVEWAGNPVAKGGLWIADGALQIEATIEDTDLKASSVLYSAGSAVEISLRDPLAAGAKWRGVVVLPDPADPQVLQRERFARGAPLEGGSAGVVPGEGAYTVRASIPLAVAGISGPFLCDIVFHINALGTAHGRIRKPWRTDGEAALLIPR